MKTGQPEAGGKTLGRVRERAHRRERGGRCLAASGSREGTRTPTFLPGRVARRATATEATEIEEGGRGGCQEGGPTAASSSAHQGRGAPSRRPNPTAPFPARHRNASASLQRTPCGAPSVSFQPSATRRGESAEPGPKRLLDDDARQARGVRVRRRARGQKWARRVDSGLADPLDRRSKLSQVHQARRRPCRDGRRIPAAGPTHERAAGLER
jgi:hypothetical protein